MKFKSIIMTVSMLFISVFSTSVISVSAENTAILDETEISGVVSAIEKENNDVAAVNEYSVFSNDSKSQYDLTIKNFDLEKAYKNYILKTFMITEYKNNPDFKSLITNDERIQVPAEGKLVSLIEEESGYSILGTTFTDNIFDLKALTDEIVSNLNEEVTEIIYTYSQLYYMDIVYIATAENEYAVPYFVEPPYAEYGDRLVSGTVYSAAEFMDRMSQTFDEEAMSTDGESNGGIPVKEYAPYVPSFTKTEISAEKDFHNFAVVAAIIAVVLSAGFLTAFIILNRKKQRN